MPLSIYNIHELYSKVWKRRRFFLFQKLISPSQTQTLIDVGGLPYFWLSNLQIVARIDLLNIVDIDWQPELYPDYNIKTIVGDGCSLGGIRDRSYDIAFSNSTIEHLGSWEKQKQFAEEMRRIGKAIWVQTPARECPIEPHYLAPFIHWLPKKLQKKLVRYFTPCGLIERPTKIEIDDMVDTTSLLTKKEMQELFPDCDILTEKLLPFIPKSYIAIRKHTSESVIMGVSGSKKIH